MTSKLWLAATYMCVAQALFAQNVRLSYFGENVTHYGMRGGIEFPLQHSEHNNSAPARQNAWLLGIHLTVFRHPHNHFGILLAPEIGWRHTGRRGGMVQAAIAMGLFRSIYEGKTYQPDAQGNFQRVPLAGQWGFLPGVSLGIGKDLSVQHDIPIILFTNVHYMQQYPYNHTYLIRPALEAGIIIKN